MPKQKIQFLVKNLAILDAFLKSFANGSTYLKDFELILCL